MYLPVNLLTCSSAPLTKLMSTLAVVLSLVRVMELFENLLKAINRSSGKVSASQCVGHRFRGVLVLCLDQAPSGLSTQRQAWLSGLGFGGLLLPQEPTCYVHTLGTDQKGSRSVSFIEPLSV